MLDEYPNFWIDTAARSELGRQPRAAARLIERHQDRVLFGADVFPIDPEAYRVYFRLLRDRGRALPVHLETRVLSTEQGRWSVYGLGLAPPLLEKLYNLNAAHLLSCDPPGISQYDRLTTSTRAGGPGHQTRKDGRVSRRPIIEGSVLPDAPRADGPSDMRAREETRK